MIMNRNTLKTCLIGASCTLGLFSISAALAGGPGQYDEPTRMHHFSIYGEGMFTKASEDGAFAITETAPTPDAVLHHQAETAFGGSVGASYKFHNRSDIRAEYFYLPGKFGDVAHAAAGGTDNYTMKLTYQGVNVDLGQNWNPVTKLTLHFFTGLAYRHSEHTSNHPYVDSGQYYGTSGNSKFSGWGPRFGIDSTYNYFTWKDFGLNLIANAALTLPYGTMKADAKKNASDAVHTENIEKFAPEIAAKLGLQINRDFNSFWLGLGAGYNVYHVINNEIDTDALGNKANSAMGFKFHDTTFYGPYIRLNARF